ncbi:hypothetical protein MFS40622_0844 [Methanocaldococcus sp. FS406-22]|uniref:pentapeptide repeat-containing protein n=1 Tax=Methanocaldococcus sp. (strain FS406-22) TaxID=644281 RepID=UPI0001BF575E|nr:pentapeptide repeat-containing protein [Methanocaldococcus sp. FS406-22]ADC69527.1 hypothetical protein MFS40622_0844 [Methanocaldococcus sp. FS406-22]
MGEVRVIDKETVKVIGDFYEMFIDALKSEKKVFKLENCIVDGNVDILKIYNRIRDNKELRKLIIEHKDDNITTINVDINLSFHDVEFKGNFQMFRNKIEIVESIRKILIRVILGNINFINSSFKGNVDFSYSVVQGEVNIIDSTFMENVIFWKSEFKKIVYFEKSTFEGDIVFKSSTFENDIYFRNSTLFNGKVDFWKSTLKRNIYFDTLIFKKDIDFGNSTFEGDINFEKSKFNGSVYFNGSTFEKKVNFDYSVFRWMVDFSESTFKGDINFRYSKFDTEISFYKSEFKEGVSVNFIGSRFLGETNFSMIVFDNGEINFEYSEFLGVVSFWKSTFVRDVSFTGLKFNREVNFSESFFKGRAVFSNVEFTEKADFATAVFNEVNFVDVRFKYADFTGCVFEKLLLFSRVFFDLIKFTGAIFEGVAYFMENENNNPNQITLFDLLKIEYLKKFKKKNNKDKNRGVALFNFVNFKSPNNITFVNFPLSRTSFLLTDVKNIAIIAEAERIFDELLLEFVDDAKKILDIEEKIVKIKQKIEPYWDILPEDEKNKLNKRLGDYKKQLNEAWKNLINKIKQKINFENDDLYILFTEAYVYGISPYLRPETVLKEYRDIRKSFENNRTYVEASELFIYEMDLLRKIIIPNYDKYKIPIFSILLVIIFGVLFGLYFVIIPALLIILVWVILYIIRYLGIIEYLLKILKIRYLREFLEGIAFDIYKIISNYGESLVKPIIITILVILIIPCIITHSWNPFSDKILLEQTLRAFFQLGIDKNTINNNPELQTLASYEWLIRIISLILLGNIFIAIKRRLERK